MPWPILEAPVAVCEHFPIHKVSFLPGVTLAGSSIEGVPQDRDREMNSGIA